MERTTTSSFILCHCFTENPCLSRPPRYKLASPVFDFLFLAFAKSAIDPKPSADGSYNDLPSCAIITHVCNGVLVFGCSLRGALEKGCKWRLPTATRKPQERSNGHPSTRRHTNGGKDGMGVRDGQTIRSCVFSAHRRRPMPHCALAALCPAAALSAAAAPPWTRQCSPLVHAPHEDKKEMQVSKAREQVGAHVR
jgi:hypothetical protein